ncbi:aldehyde dehydrogenase (NADP(+)) [Pyxidicoccus parkwayensis]|uniref:Aldehyde dehydrogenase (NADP(+)) n=1 Tax=Pyxidicoccus parkwayensis TaxID=2813578 RepID=A0ABX7P3I5_9BACT|nr:aldehyde dehydrogenase (NADP(+)) [Pyxidicoccus parkwaysis]QSQ25005.1 aldehyde dehydrogenase (NADP(+)) [Pyxidicoccus parkwaysis]
MEWQGLSLIGTGRGEPGGKSFTGWDPAAGVALEPRYHSAHPHEVERACKLAEEAAPAFAALPSRQRAVFLEHIAEALLAAEADFLAVTPRETGLPTARIQGELGRAAGQFRQFAKLLEEGSWVDARIDHAMPDRRPAPRPDLRSMLRALGPVAVFGASNFPLAFSTAGGDTASALAAGCPVIVKAHPAHPATSERAGEAIRAAVTACGLPEGVFSLLFDAGMDVGRALVKHPAIRAVGFTGSRAGGRALMDLAAARAAPIPVFAEMGSINPVFVLPEALATRPEAVADALATSILQGAGQFCTSPGLLVAAEGPGYESFRARLVERLGAVSAVPMLTPGIAERFRESVARLAARTDTRTWVRGEGREAHGAPALFEVVASAVLTDAALTDEVFGSCAVLVRTREPRDITRVASHLEGQLTATLMVEPGDHALASEMLPVLADRVGRVLVNGVPTGVEVCPSMVHGGPYPASADGRFTAVGTGALRRFVRPVCFQDVPEPLLPAELRDANPLDLWRTVDGVLARK